MLYYLVWWNDPDLYDDEITKTNTLRLDQDQTQIFLSRLLFLYDSIFKAFFLAPTGALEEAIL